MLEIPAGWLLVKDVVEVLNLLREVQAELREDRIGEILDTMSEVFDTTASRNLMEAADRSGEARRTKLKVAVTHLEGAYTVKTWIIGDGVKAGRFRKRKKYETLVLLENLCQHATVTAAVYQAIDEDPTSVGEWLDRCGDAAVMWRQVNLTLFAGSFDTDKPAGPGLGGGYSAPAWGYPHVSAWEMQRRRLEEFDVGLTAGFAAVEAGTDPNNIGPGPAPAT